MQRVLLLFVCLAVVGLSRLHAQPPTRGLSPGVADALTRIIQRDGTTTAGLFVGLNQDSLFLMVGGKLQKYSRHDLLRLTMERPAVTSGAALTGLITGVYAGNLLFLRAENEPFAFRRQEEEPGLDILYNLAFACVGGVIGYLVGSSTGGDEVYDFTQSEETDGGEWERLRESVTDARHEPSVHISLQGSWVKAYLPDSPGSYSYPTFSRSTATQLNMLRRLQVVVELSSLVEGGGAVMWLGQPTSFWSNSAPSTYSSGTAWMTGHGYYAVGVFTPLPSHAPRGFQWDIGAGVGIAQVDYTARNMSGSYPYTASTVSVTTREIFSGFVYTEVRLYFQEHFSLGLVGDYVYLPETVPAIPEIGFESRQMGTTSIGFVLGLHL